MDFGEKITLTDQNGHVTIPLVNLLRITLVRMQDLFIQYQQETKDSTISGFNRWMKEKLGMKGKQVLM